MSVDLHSSDGRWVGAPLLRREDPALLTGSCSYMADLVDEKTLHVGFVRSTSAHADIVSVDVVKQRPCPG